MKKLLIIAASLFILAGCETMDYSSVTVSTGSTYYHPPAHTTYIRYTLGYYTDSYYHGYRVRGHHGHRYYYAPRSWSHHRYYARPPVIVRHHHHYHQPKKHKRHDRRHDRRDHRRDHDRREYRRDHYRDDRRHKR